LNDLGELKWILGVKLDRTNGYLCISQEKYIDDILKKFGLENCKPAPTPMDPAYLKEDETDPKREIDHSRQKDLKQIIGSLMYAATITRPDISFAVNKISQKSHVPTQADLIAAKRILRYLKGTKHYSICYAPTGHTKLV